MSLCPSPAPRDHAKGSHVSRSYPTKLEPGITPGSWPWEAGSPLAGFLGLLSSLAPSTPRAPGKRGWRERGTLPFLSAALHGPAPQGRALHPHHRGHPQVSPLPPRDRCLVPGPSDQQPPHLPHAHRSPDVLKDFAPGSQLPILLHDGDTKTDTLQIEEFLEETLGPPE